MIKPRALVLRAEVILNFVRRNDHGHGPVREIKIWILQGFLFLLEFKDIHVKLRQRCRIHRPNRKVLYAARPRVFRVGKYPDELFLPRFSDVENISFRIVAAVIDKRSTRGPFHRANGRILFLDSLEHLANIVDRHPEMIEPARISWATLIEGNADVAIARDDRSSKGGRDAARVQDSMPGCVGALTLLGGVADICPEIEQTLIKFKQTRRRLTHDTDMFDSGGHDLSPCFRSADTNIF